MSNQTAVKLIFEKFNLLSDADFKTWMLNNHDSLQAMEKEQIVDACNSQRNDYRGMPTYNKSGEQYYNEIYGGDK
jgi:hypothetical protein